MSEFNFGFQNELNQNSEPPIDNCKSPGILDFRPYGKVIGVDITLAELELSEHMWAAGITEVPKLDDYAYVGYFSAIGVEIPVQDIQKIIRREINRLVPTFNKLVQEELEESEKSTFYYIKRRHLIEYVQYKNVNPFEFFVQLVHRKPSQESWMRDDIYEFMLSQKDLYLNMRVRIYYRNVEKDGVKKKIHYITVMRTDGSSLAIYDFYKNLKDALERAEKLHKLFDGKK